VLGLSYTGNLSECLRNSWKERRDGKVQRLNIVTVRKSGTGQKKKIVCLFILVQCVRPSVYVALPLVVARATSRKVA
jgi:hypothetical protein